MRGRLGAALGSSRRAQQRPVWVSFPFPLSCAGTLAQPRGSAQPQGDTRALYIRAGPAASKPQTHKCPGEGVCPRHRLTGVNGCSASGTKEVLRQGCVFLHTQLGQPAAGQLLAVLVEGEGLASSKPGLPGFVLSLWPLVLLQLPSCTTCLLWLGICCPQDFPCSLERPWLLINTTC